ncbi:leucine-rich repeat-containing protein 19-like isoform X2 [Eleginops maclovinus]|uniref:leucine-rich repeat-containing protein 19-like isoform X2 n=1 Tax=Eleginops maclovinus TaxID=56733 RepID=UPI003080FF1E
MEGCPKPVLLLLMVVTMNILGSNAEVVEENTLVKNLTNKLLTAIPGSDNSSSVTTLLLEGNLITLNEADRRALASYTALEELRLDANLVSSIPAQYFSVTPLLRVLSLSRNNISSMDPDALSNLDVLTELDLSHNLLTSLPTRQLQQKNIEVLSLQDNPWNCSCPLLSSFGKFKAAGGKTGGQHVACASPEKQAGRDLWEAANMCLPSAPPIFTTTLTKPLNSQQPGGLSSTPTAKQSNKDGKPVLGHTWKFTACVAALALCTSMIIVCGVKGPSWYKLFYNYRHRRLHQEEDEQGVSTVFSEKGRYMNHQTFNFTQENGQLEEEEEEEEDEYFEDPYIKRED